MHERLLQGFYIGDRFVNPVEGSVTADGTVHQMTDAAIAILMHLAEMPLQTVPREELIRVCWPGLDAGDADLSAAVREVNQVLGERPNGAAFVDASAQSGCRLAVEPKGAATPRARSPDTVVQEASHKTGFVEQLRQRGVIEVAVAYVIVGWLLLQIADVTFDQLGLPQWAGTFVAFLVIFGFPIAVLLAWFIELTDAGAIIDRDPTRRRRQSFGKPYVAIVGALAVAAVGVFLYDRYIGLPGDPALADTVAAEGTAISVEPNSIAVLPFFNIDGSEETQIFSNGLAEDVINRLARVPGLRVSARGDSFSLAPNTASREVRNRLRVAYYLEGSVRLSEGTLRAVVQLIDSESGFHLLSRSFDRELDDYFELQDDITSLTVANLRVALPRSAPSSEPLISETTELDAYVFYRQGMDVLYQPLTRETISVALDAFERSLSVDPDYAAAHAGICSTYSSGYDVTLDPEFIDLAESSCAAALALNSNLGIVHVALGDLNLRTGNDARAKRAYELALAINSSDVSALTGLGNVYFEQQEFDQAERHFRQAIGLQPGNWNSYRWLGRFLYLSGRYEEAAAQYREVVSLDAQNFDGWTNLATALMLSGRFAEAAAAFERAVEIQARSTTYANLGLLHYYLGETAEATAMLELAVQAEPNDHLAWSNLGDVLTAANRRDDAQQAFRTADALASEKLQVNEKDAELVIDLAWIKAMLGDSVRAQQLIETAREVAPSDPYVYFIDALVNVRAGSFDAALDSLETAASMGYPLALIAVEPHLESLRERPRFDRLIAEQ